MDFATLIARMRQRNAFSRIAQNARVQFGPAPARYIGAELLPNVRVDENYFYQEYFEFVTVIASDSTRYAPPVKKQGGRISAVLVQLGEIAHAVELDPAQYDHVVRILRRRVEDAEAWFAAFVDTAVNQALSMKEEKQRWDILATGQTDIVLGNTTQTVQMPVQAGHIAAAGGDWSDPDYDPMDDLYERAQLLIDAGRRPNRIITSNAAINKFAANPKIRARTGRVAITQAGDLIGLSGRATLQDVNALLAADNLPPFEPYEERYRYQTADGSTTERFLPADTLVMTAVTGNTIELELPANDADAVQMNTLGFNGVGTVSGHPEPGRAIAVDVQSTQNTVRPRVAVEGAQTSFPVIVDPLSIAVLNGIQ